MQALPVLERLVELDLRRDGREVVDPEVPHSLPLRLGVAVHGVGGVAGVAGVIARHAAVLEVRRRTGRTDRRARAITVGLHDVARQAELRRLRRLQVRVQAEGGRHRRQHRHRDQGQVRVPAGADRERRARHHDDDHQHRHQRNAIEAMVVSVIDFLEGLGATKSRRNRRSEPTHPLGWCAAFAMPRRFRLLRETIRWWTIARHRATRRDGGSSIASWAGLSAP